MRMLRAYWQETVKRLPYIASILLLLALIVGLQSYRKTSENVAISRANSEVQKVLLAKIGGLAADNKRLAQQANDIAGKNQQHIDCIAHLFARYTHNLRPITIQDLDTCTAPESRRQSSNPAPTNSSENKSTTQSQNQNNNTNRGQGNQNPNPPNTPDEPERPPVTIETPFGDIPACVEVLNLCVRR